MKTNYLFIDDLNLIDGDYFCWISNFYDADRDIKTNETYNDGSTFNRSKTKERKFLLNGYIKSRTAVNELRQKLFNGDLKKVAVGTKDMPTVFVMCDLINFAEDSKLPGKISCQMIAPDPYLYEITPEQISLGAASNNGLSFPLVFPISFGEITGGQGTLTNKGNALSYPIITIEGTCSNITISNITTGESMSLDVSLPTDYDTLVIDSSPSNRGIYFNGVKRMDLKNGDWFTCPPGDNIFTFQRNSLQTKQHCSISLQSRWI